MYTQLDISRKSKWKPDSLATDSDLSSFNDHYQNFMNFPQSIFEENAAMSGEQARKLIETMKVPIFLSVWGCEEIDLYVSFSGQGSLSRGHLWSDSEDS